MPHLTHRVSGKLFNNLFNGTEEAGTSSSTRIAQAV
jgi:hypothetical protein